MHRATFIGRANFSPIVPVEHFIWLLLIGIIFTFLIFPRNRLYQNLYREIIFYINIQSYRFVNKLLICDVQYYLAIKYKFYIIKSIFNIN